MSYFVQFLGLSCFCPWKDGQIVLLPNGRFPPPQIIPEHIAWISVNTADLLPTGTEGWPDNQVTVNGDQTEFQFAPSRIRFPADAGKLTVPDLDGDLGSIPVAYPNYRVGFGTNWIAIVELHAGTLRAFRWPGSPPTPDAELLMSWEVPYDGDITIRVTDRKGWPTRTIGVRANSEIALANMSRGVPGNHFPLYAEISANPVTLEALPLRSGAVLTPLSSGLAFFQAPQPASSIDGGGCSPRTGTTGGG